jgi:uracil-DNA glycosylase family 4
MESDSPHAQVRHITHALRFYVESLKEAGVVGLPCTVHADMGGQSQMSSDRSNQSGASAEPSPESPLESFVQAVPVHKQPSLEQPALQVVQTLDALRAEIGDCRRCTLCEKRTQIVFGVGDPHAELVFVGEGPGHDEDIKGEPFVGRAGQLLTEIITKGMKMRREEVYIANVVKCRPPQNRNPEPEEIAACEPFLRKQLELIQPRIIVALGAFASQTLLKTKTPISRLRGVWHTYRGMQLMPTLHPAYLLRNPKDKRLVWEDIKAVLREMGKL